MTDTELQALIASVFHAQKELTEQQKRTDEQLARTDAQLAETDRKLNRVAEMVGNIGNHQGDIAEEFFYRSFVENPVLGNIRYRRYAGVATLVTYPELIDKAQELGLFLFTQQGDHAEIVQQGRVLQ